LARNLTRTGVQVAKHRCN